MPLFRLRWCWFPELFFVVEPRPAAGGSCTLYLGLADPVGSPWSQRGRVPWALSGRAPSVAASLRWFPSLVTGLRSVAYRTMTFYPSSLSLFAR